jgi:putative salt-induced outer membrane protein YdiY
MLLATPAWLAAQDGEFTWENTTELSFVSTSGNASSSTLGLKASLIGTGGPNSFRIEIGGIRGESHTTTRTATGTAGTFTVNETSTSQLTAESYFARGRYDRSLGPAFLFAGVGWDRNTFAGVQNRYAFVSGVGRTWVDSETGRFKTDVGGTYTIQKDVDPAPDANEAFAGFRASVDARRRITESSQYTTTLVADQNAEQSEDFRADWINSLSFQLTEALAFKTSLQLLYDHQPSLIEVPLFDTGGAQTGTVLTPGDEVDSVLTVTLAITL